VTAVRLGVWNTRSAAFWLIAAADPGDIEAWAAAMTVAPGTVATARQHLGQILTAAVKDGLIPRNPATGARLPKLEQHRAQPVTLEDLDALSAAAPDWFRVSIVLAAGLGLRQAEATGLTIDRVDFLRRVVRVDRQLVTPPTGLPLLAPPKTPSSYRSIPLPSFVADAISAHVAEHGTGRDGLVLHLVNDGPINRSRFSREWGLVRAAAGVSSSIRYHDLRHTFASTLLSSGVSVKAVADWLGHASPTITLDTYAHLMPVDDDRARVVLDRAFARRDEDQVRTAGGQ
jgi:integrase